MSDGAGENISAVILVVDDDRATRRILRYGLEKGGYRVVEGEDGGQTLALCERHRPDLIILDCMMPVMDGFTTCARLKDSPHKATPVLMLTGLEDQRSMEMALAVGAADFVSKPVNLAVLNQRVRLIVQARRTEIELDRSEHGIRSLLTAVVDGIVTIDARGEIKSFNPAAQLMFGYFPSEVEATSIASLMEGIIRKEDLLSTAGTDQENRSFAFHAKREVTARRKDGSFFPAEVTISGFHSGDRLLTVRDITERKESERRLHLGARVLQNVAEGIMVTSADGVIELVNPAFCAITGYSEREVIGSSQRLLKPDQHDGRIWRDVWRECLGKGHWEGQLWNRRKNGDIFPVRLSCSIIRDEAGDVVSCVNVFSDITDQVRLAEEKERMAEQNVRSQRLASLGTMSAGIAHEINQPLNVIKVMVDGMLYWHQRGRTPDQARIMETMQKVSAQVNRIDEIIKHMRSFINLSGQIGPVKPCDLDTVLESALNMLGTQIQAHNITLRKIPVTGVLLVKANATRLEEVVINLLVNAMQALDSCAKTPKEITISSHTAGNTAVLEIADNATGIPADSMQRIFDPFFTTKTGGDGMGLGLSIAQSIANSYGGVIRAENNDRGGASFHVELPLPNG